MMQYVYFYGALGMALVAVILVMSAYQPFVGDRGSVNLTADPNKAPAELKRARRSLWTGLGFAVLAIALYCAYMKNT